MLSLNEYLNDQDAQDELEEHLEIQALLIAYELKSPLGFTVGLLNYDMSDVLADDEHLAEQLRCCLAFGYFNSMEEYLEEAVYKYALELATEVYKSCCI